jgi:N-acetylmuramoyl-L-alanine amidase
MKRSLMREKLTYQAVLAGGLAASSSVSWLILAWCWIPVAYGQANTTSLVRTSQVVAQATAGMSRATLRLGSQGADVSELQGVLQLLGYFSGTVDGTFGEETASAVAGFQKAVGLEPDGVVGVGTWARLFPAPISSNPSAPAPKPSVTTAKPTPKPSPTPVSSTVPTQTVATSSSTAASLPILKLGMRGSAVSGLQERLKTVGLFKGAVDGVFGTETQEAVKSAQRRYKLDPDGVVGDSTWLVLLRS